MLILAFEASFEKIRMLRSFVGNANRHPDFPMLVNIIHCDITSTGSNQGKHC